MTNDSYEIGYRKPPKHTRFQKGRSGKSKGKAKSAEESPCPNPKIFGEKVVVKDHGKTRSMKKLEAALVQLVNKALSGDIKAFPVLIRLRKKCKSRSHISLPLRSFLSSTLSILLPNNRPQRRSSNDRQGYEHILGESWKPLISRWGHTHTKSASTLIPARSGQSRSRPASFVFSTLLRPCALCPATAPALAEARSSGPEVDHVRAAVGPGEPDLARLRHIVDSRPPALNNMIHFCAYALCLLS